MSQVLILSGSSRSNGVSYKILPLVETEVNSREGLEAKVVDVASLNLPFFNGTISPSTEGFVPKDANAAAWTKMVADADAVILVTPEYNGGLSAIQKNAIDWISKEWVEKPVALVGYGWSGATRAHDNARIALATVKANALTTAANLSFMQEISIDGEVLDADKVSTQLKAVVDAVVAAI